MQVWGMHERTQIELSAADRAELKTIVANRLVLLTADGHGTAEIMRRTGKAKTVIWRWQKRFSAEASPPCGGTRRGPRASRRWLPRLPSAWWP